MTLIDCGIVRLDHPLLHDVVSERSLRRWRRVWSANGGSFSSQRAQIRPGPQPLLPPEAIDYLRRRLEQKGTMTLAGLARCLEDTPWPVVSTSSIHRMIKGIAFTRKRSFKHAAQQCPIKRRDFLMRTAFYTPEQLVFIDESGFDAKVYESNYSYSAKGTRAITPVRFNRGVRWSILPAISLSRPLFAERIFDGTLNGELFEDWIANVLLPQCEPYPGKRSVIILDNCRVHHREGIREMVEAAGEFKQCPRCLQSMTW